MVNVNRTIPSLPGSARDLRILLVDDHQLFRDGLRLLIESENGLRLAAEAPDAREAYRIATAQEMDLALLDISLPGTSGLFAARELRRLLPDMQIAFLTACVDLQTVRQALATGARGYILKDQGADDVIAAIRAIARGEQYLAPQVKTLLQSSAPLDRGDGRSSSLSVLTHREREVFDLLVRGFGNPAIARELCIAVRTVETHRARILSKLGLHSMADLVRFAARLDLLPKAL